MVISKVELFLGWSGLQKAHHILTKKIWKINCTSFPSFSAKNYSGQKLMNWLFFSVHSNLFIFLEVFWNIRIFLRFSYEIFPEYKAFRLSAYFF